MDRAEILGRLALDLSPSYIAHLVKTRGVAFSPSLQFVDQVRQAGGAGILLDTLPNAAVADAGVATQQAEAPVEHLAACAKSMHAHDYDGAEKECRASIRETPASQWPYRAMAWLLQNQIPPVLDTDPENKARRAEQDALWQQAAALTPAVTLDPDFPKAPQGYGGVAVTAKQQVVFAREFIESDERLVSGDAMGQLLGLALRDPLSPRKTEDSVPTSDISIEIPEGLAARIQVEPDLASNHLALAVLYEDDGHDFAQAERELHEAIRLEPDAERPHAHLAVFYDKRSDYEGSIAELREVVRIAPFSTLEHAALARELEVAGRIPDATAELRSMTAMWPDDIEVSNDLMRLYLRHKDHKGAIEEIRRSLKATSVYYADESKFVEARFGSEEELGNLLDEARDFDGAAEQFLLLLRVVPDNSLLHLDYGNVLMDQRLCDRAVSEYNEALRLDPTMGIAHSNIGQCRAAANDLDGAIAEFRQAIEIEPNDPYPPIGLGMALAQKGDSEAARQQFRQILADRPDDVDAHVEFGEALFLLKDPAAAIRESKKALELKPESAYAQNDLAWIYCATDDPKYRNPAEALALARKAVASQEIPNASYLDTLAEALLQNGQPQEALATEMKAIDADPGDTRLPPRLDYFRKAAQKSTPAHAEPASASQRQ